MMFDYELERARAAQAMTQAQIEAQQRRAYQSYRNAQFSTDYLLGLQNYRQPVHVPEGWAYWSKNADALYP